MKKKSSYINNILSSCKQRLSKPGPTGCKENNTMADREPTSVTDTSTTKQTHTKKESVIRRRNTTQARGRTALVGNNGDE